jgi:glycosyltransferase involved in cell wall biosynthesis
MGAAARPFFSILIPSYNRPQRIARCIESILANHEEDIEIIISDDASPQRDAIANAVRPYLCLPNVHFHQQSANLGEPGNRNYLVSRATGQYNIILCDDDTLFPHSLMTIRRYIQQAPGNDLYMLGYRVINDLGVASWDRVAPRTFTIGPGRHDLIRWMFEGTWLPFLMFHPATFCCKRGVEREIPYREDVYTADDYMFLLECLKKQKRMHVLPECLLKYLQASEGATQVNQSADKVTVVKAYTKVYYAIRSESDLDPWLARYVHGETYRQRFLYDFIIRRLPKTTNLVQLNFTSRDEQDLAAYITQQYRLTVFIRTGIRILYELTQQFGLAGAVYSMQIGFRYLSHRLVLDGTVGKRKFAS